MIEHKKLQWPNYPLKVKIRFKSRPGIGRVDHQEMEVLILYSPTQVVCKAYVRASLPPKPYKGTVSYSISMFEIVWNIANISLCEGIPPSHLNSTCLILGHFSDSGPFIATLPNQKNLDYGQIRTPSKNDPDIY